MAVTLVNTLKVIGKVEDFERVTADITEYMRRQPGYISHQMLRSLRNPDVFVELAYWEKAENHLAAIQSEGFRSRVAGLAGVIEKPTPDLYEVIHEAVAA
jgi:heme-degrading monooxygenase HmoA